MTRRRSPRSVAVLAAAVALAMVAVVSPSPSAGATTTGGPGVDPDPMTVFFAADPRPTDEYALGGIYRTPADDVFLRASRTVVSANPGIYIWGGPMVSPDGTRVADVEFPPANGGSASECVALTDLLSGARTNLSCTAPFTATTSSQYDGLTWSPDSSLLAFTVESLENNTGWTYQLDTVSASGGGAHVVTGADDLMRPTFDPADASMLAAVRLDGALVTAHYDRATNTVSGVTPVVLPADPRSVVYPGHLAWSIDGTRIAAEYGGIAVVDLRDPVPHYAHVMSGSDPAWAPNGDLWADYGAYYIRGSQLESSSYADGQWTPAVFHAPVEALAGTGTKFPSFAYKVAPPPGWIGPDAARWAPATVAGSRATLRWHNPYDADFDHVVVTRNGVRIYTGTASTFADSGLVVGHTYTYGITAYDAAGHPQGATTANPGGTGASVNKLVPLARPTLSAPSFVSAVNSVWVWPVTLRGAPTPGYERSAGYYVVQRAVRVAPDWSLGPYQTVDYPTARHTPIDTAGTVDSQRGVLGATYYYRPIVIDGYGNTTTGATVVTLVPLDQTAATRSAGWTTYGSSSYWARSADRATTSGRTMTLQVNARTVGVLVLTCPTCGSFTVDLDGARVATVSTKASTKHFRHLVWSHAFSSIGSHTLTITSVVAAGQQLIVDGFEAVR